jgi:hypothetical protein
MTGPRVPGSPYPRWGIAIGAPRWRSQQGLAGELWPPAGPLTGSFLAVGRWWGARAGLVAGLEGQQQLAELLALAMVKA